MRSNVSYNKRFWTLNEMAAAGLGVLGGIWLIVSPYLFGYSNLTGALKVNGDNATLMGLITGSAAIMLALLAAATTRLAALRPYRLAAGMAMIGLGLLLMIAPYLFNYAILRDPLWNLQITGAIFILVAGYIVQEINNLGQ